VEFTIVHGLPTAMTMRLVLERPRNADVIFVCVFSQRISLVIVVILEQFLQFATTAAIEETPVGQITNTIIFKHEYFARQTVVFACAIVHKTLVA
jgi:uncharacterized membrane protein